MVGLAGWVIGRSIQKKKSVRLKAFCKNVLLGSIIETDKKKQIKRMSKKNKCK